MTESPSLSHQPPIQTNETPSPASAQGTQRLLFALTEAQRIFIQYHLPKKFTLLPVPSCLRRSGSSKALLEDSLTFIQRKRGRPEGSTRKHIFSRSGRERKSQRIANVCRPNYHALQEQSQADSLGDSLEEDRRGNASGREEEVQFVKEGYDQEGKEGIQVSLEEGLRKDPEKVENQVIPAKQEAPPSEPVEVKQEPNENPQSCLPQKQPEQQPLKRPSKKRSKKTFPLSLPLPSQPTPPPQGQILQTPAQKAEQLQDFAKQLKTQPSSKGLVGQTGKFDWQRTIIRRLKSHKEIFPFLQPVDEVRDGAPGYYQAISSPIDLQTIQFKLKTGIYKVPQQFHADVRLMWANSKTYNRKNEFMQQVTEELEGFYLHLLTRPKCGRKKKQP